ERLRQFITQLNRQAKTVIIVTHDTEFVAECQPRIVLMAQGKIVGEGEARKILTDPELVKEASVVLPEIAQIFLRLEEQGFPRDVLDVSEAGRILLERFGGSS
ncbi:MAG: hypothetical protein OEZ24_04675, partial [Candidatus Bathyarchaeota archaeon]|nr:hypothetical protein [Candidatus Bathyarchaeota archaeon]